MTFLTQLTSSYKPTQKLDATELNCPLPLLKLKQALHSLASGECVYLLTSDASSPIDIERFCQKNAHQFLCFRAQGVPCDSKELKGENEGKMHDSFDTICHLIITKG